MSITIVFPESSNIHSLEYSADTEPAVLFATFKGAKDTTAYSYEGVPADVWEALERAGREGSIGQAFTKLIRQRADLYPYRKLPEYHLPADAIEIRRCICTPDVVQVYGHSTSCPLYAAPAGTLQQTRNRTVGRRNR